MIETILTIFVLLFLGALIGVGILFAIARQVKHTVVPMNKSNYMLVTDRSLLTQLNPKRTTP